MGVYYIIGASEVSPFLVCNVEILSVCLCVCLSVMDRHPIFAFVTRDPYPFNFAELAPHNALSIPLVIGASEASPFLVCNVEILSVCLCVCVCVCVSVCHGPARY